MNDVFRADDKKHDHALHGEEGKIDYRDFGHWANLADESESAEEFERSVLEEQVEHLKKYVTRELTSRARVATTRTRKRPTLPREPCGTSSGKGLA